MRKRYMGHEAIAKKRRSAILGTVEKLVRHQKLSRPQIFFQRSDGARGNNAFHAQQLHRVNVRSVIDFAWQNAMPASVPRQKRHALPFERSQHERI